MQTTLRIDDQLYREAKAEAARQGTTLTRFLEEGLRLRLEKKLVPAKKPHSFRVHSSGKMDAKPWEEIRKVADDEQQKQDLAKLEVIGNRR